MTHGCVVLTATRGGFIPGARRDGAVTVRVTIATEGLTALLSFAERLRALTGNGLVSPATDGEQERSHNGHEGQIALGHRPASWVGRRCRRGLSLGSVGVELGVQPSTGVRGHRRTAGRTERS
jgi:hypothetical protein